MKELQEVRQMITRQMQTEGFVPPTFFLVGTTSQLGYTCTSFHKDMDEAIAPIRKLGQQLAGEHPEVGKLMRAYFAAVGLRTSSSDEQPPQEVLTIHGVKVATNEQEAVLWEVLRDHNQHDMPFKALKELHPDGAVPEHPVLQAFVDGYLSFD